MLRTALCAIALIGLVATQAPADVVWMGTVSNDWNDANNWFNPVTMTNQLPTSPSQRALIEATSDLANWPTIKNGVVVDMTTRDVRAPNAVSASAPNFARLTIDSGGELKMPSGDFRFGQNAGTASSGNGSITISVNVAGTLTLGSGRARFAALDNTKGSVVVTGTMTKAVGQDFSIGNAGTGYATFDISGNGSVSDAATFLIGSPAGNPANAGGFLTLADNAKLTLLPSANAGGLAGVLTNMSTLAGLGRVTGLTNTYSGPESLTFLGNGVSYFGDGTTSYTFVAAIVAGIPEPTSMLFMAVATLTTSLIVFCRKLRGSPLTR